MGSVQIDAPLVDNIAAGLRHNRRNRLETDRLWQKMYRSTMYCGCQPDYDHGQRPRSIPASVISKANIS